MSELGELPFPPDDEPFESEYETRNTNSYDAVHRGERVLLLRDQHPLSKKHAEDIAPQARDLEILRAPLALPVPPDEPDRGRVVAWEVPLRDAAAAASDDRGRPLRPERDPHLSADRLAELLEVRKATMAGKAKRIRDALGLDPMDVEFCRRELLEEHPFAWLIEVDGIIVDARSMPTDLQAEARRRGLIPDIPLGEAA